jgi:hypothetical protein
MSFFIGSGSVRSGSVAVAAVLSGSIGVSSVISGNIAVDAVTSGALASGSLGNVQIASGGLTSGSIASGSIGNVQIASGGLTSGAIASGSIGTVQVSSGGLLSGALASGQIGQVHLAFGAGTVFVQTADATVANTTTENTLATSGVGSLTLLANLLAAGKNVRITARGYVSETGNPTLRVKIKFGSTIILDTTAVSFSGNLTNQEWALSADITCRTAGVSGTVMGQGRFVSETGDVFGMVRTAPVTVDTTITEAIDVTAQWSTASASLTITCTNLMVEVLG